MSKSLYLLGLLVLVLHTTMTADVHPYDPQGTIPLVPDITNLGYSPNQKHLIVLANSIPETNFVHFHGLRLNSRQDITIIDAGAASVKPSAFAFSKDGSWLVVGTSWGAIYGYQVTDGELPSSYKYKKHIGNGEPEDGIKAISFSADGQIAVAAKDLLVVLEVPDNETAIDFNERTRHNCSTILSSVAWKHNSKDLVIVGGQRTNAFFHIIDVSKETIIPVPIVSPPEQTLSIGVFSDASETLLQGRLNGAIRIFYWNEANGNYEGQETIADAVNASEISITSDNMYFAAEINTNGQVFAWKSNLQINSEAHLQNQLPQSINPSIVLTTAGKNLALSNDGNRILIIGQNQTAKKFSICDSNQWYDSTNKVCQPCQNGCGSCFNSNDCQSCPDKTTYIDTQNTCQPCSDIKTGCKECQTKTNCDACNTDDHFNPTPDPNDNSCKCASQYYEDNNQCKQCKVINFCLECESATKCTTCIDTDHIDKKPAANGTCICVAGWYLDGICKDCTQRIGCKECASATNCTLCDHGNNWTQDPSGKCICQPGYWQNGNNCEPCGNKTPNCTACQQDGVCTKCIDTRVVSEDKTKCICQGHTYEDTTTQKCELCDAKMKCLHCDPTDNHTCYECDYIDGHRKKQPVDGKCECQPGFTQNPQQVCTQCQIDGCEVCAALDQCTHCFVEKNFKPDPVDKACVCEDGYLPKKDKQSCSTCGKEIPGCTQCQDLEVCLACSAENHFLPQPNGQNKCSCAATYFLNDTLCELCSLEYKNCQECSDTQCTKCQANYLLSDDNKKCFTCVQAIPGCKTCTDLKTCTECNAQKFWQPASDNKTCACKLSYYKNGTECKLCAYQFPYCSNCSKEVCFSCQQTFTYNPELKTCFCGDDKEVKDGKCEDQSGLSALAIIAIIVGILAVAGAAVAIIKCFKKRQSPLEDGEYEALEGEKNQ